VREGVPLAVPLLLTEPVPVALKALEGDRAGDLDSDEVPLCVRVAPGDREADADAVGFAEAPGVREREV
jgi:hypothetical protein